MVNQQVQYQTNWHKAGDNLDIASRMNKRGTERLKKVEIMNLGLDNWIRTNIHSKFILNLLGRVDGDAHKLNLVMALYRREIYQQEYFTLLEHVAYRRQCLKYGDKSIHPIIETHIELFYTNGYSQNAISHITSVSQQTISSRMKGITQQYKYGQIIETLPDLRYIDLEKWLIKEDPSKTGLYLTVEQRMWIQNLRRKGYSKPQIKEITSFSARAIDRWYYAPDIQK